MFRVMIADDEHVIKNGLKNFIDWDELDCQIVSEASNGLEALEELKTKKIDIVITDIKMPGLNGIELSEAVSKHYPKTKVILLTGFADFSFAQSAIQYGVIDFIIKTNPLDKIQEAIRKAKSFIIQQREADSKIRQLEEVMTNTIPEIKRSFLQDVLHRSIHPADVETKAQSLGINLKHYFILAFDIKTKADTDSYNPDKEEHLITSVIHFLNQSFKDYSPILLIPSNETVILLVSFEEDDYSLHIRDVNRICNELIEISESFMNTVVSVGVSNMHTSLLELHIAYQEAKQALSEQFYTGLQISMIESVTSIVSAKGNDNISIEKVISYIEANYSNDIDLQTLANHVHLNSSYLSRLFKKETGETITEAITRYRIQQAKLLLQNSETKAYVVGMMVGIGDSAYFSNVFKKYTGLSPKDYRAKFR
ncbi:response regulator [Paenibacillus contaminans]|uniref:response regulator n=1 Tax=Paenibacillus contaminans TaxID=450362 RepID=UPI001314360F|nr:response regulator [Paenibacillus contaminans]